MVSNAPWSFEEVICRTQISSSGWRKQQKAIFPNVDTRGFEEEKGGRGWQCVFAFRDLNSP